MGSTFEELSETYRIDLLTHALATLTCEERGLLMRYYQDEQSIRSRLALSKELGIPLNALRIRVHRLKLKLERHMYQLVHDDAPATPIEEPKPVPPAQHMEQLVHNEAPVIPAEEPKPKPVSPPTHSQTPPMEFLRHLLQTRFPVLYAQVLEPTLADLRQEHSAAIAEGCPLKARLVLLQGCIALAAAAVCQLGFSLRGRIAAFWKARSFK